jgi:hypothetical protein
VHTPSPHIGAASGALSLLLLVAHAAIATARAHDSPIFLIIIEAHRIPDIALINTKVSTK